MQDLNAYLKDLNDENKEEEEAPKEEEKVEEVIEEYENPKTPGITSVFHNLTFFGSFV